MRLDAILHELRLNVIRIKLQTRLDAYRVSTETFSASKRNFSSKHI